MKCNNSDCHNLVKHEGDYCDECLQEQADIIREGER